MRNFRLSFLDRLTHFESLEKYLSIFGKYLSVWLCMTQILWPRWRKKCLTEFHEILYSVAFQNKFVVIGVRFWWTSLNRWLCYSVLFTIVEKLHGHFRGTINNWSFM